MRARVEHEDRPAASLERGAFVGGENARPIDHHRRITRRLRRPALLAHNPAPLPQRLRECLAPARQEKRLPGRRLQAIRGHVPQELRRDWILLAENDPRIEERALPVRNLQKRGVGEARRSAELDDRARVARRRLAESMEAGD